MKNGKILKICTQTPRRCHGFAVVVVFVVTFFDEILDDFDDVFRIVSFSRKSNNQFRSTKQSLTSGSLTTRIF